MKSTNEIIIGKYCRAEHNVGLESNTIQLGTVDFYRKQNKNSGTFDDEEGIILYKIKDSIQLKSEISKNYFDDAIKSDGNESLIVSRSLFNITIPFEVNDGDSGNAKLSGDPTDSIEIDVTGYYYIFSATVIDDAPTLEAAKKIDVSYDSFYKIIDPGNFIKAIAMRLYEDGVNEKLFLVSMSDEPELRREHVNVHYRGGMVNYDKPKIEEMSQNNDMKLTFQDRLIKSIFNKNTRLDHAYQNEFRCVFWFTNSNGEPLKLPSNEPYKLNIDSLNDLFVNIELKK
jgi:hypothetical protein